MGCSYYFSGCLKDHKAQEEVIELVSQLYSRSTIIYPDYDKKLLARIVLDTNLLSDGSYTMFSGITDPACQFSFYGIASFGHPLETETDFVPHQFIFHRCLPGTAAYAENRDGMIVSLSLKQVKDYWSPEYDDTETHLGPLLYVRSGGEYRTSAGDGGLALLLNLIKLRWMPDLEMSDDYDCCDRMEYRIHYHGLAGKLSRKSLTFEDCWEIVGDLW